MFFCYVIIYIITHQLAENRMPTFMTHPMQIQTLCYIIPQVKARCLVLIASVSVIFSTSIIGDGTAPSRGYQAL